MITLTDSAIQHIQTMLKNKAENAAFRIAVKKTGCSGYQYVLAVVFEKKDGDVVIPVSDFLVYLDAAAVPMIKGTVVDYVKKGLGVYQLTFNNPNADSLCGCGESFNLKEC